MELHFALFTKQYQIDKIKNLMGETYSTEGTRRSSYKILIE
jgi:hypothetical protein